MWMGKEGGNVKLPKPAAQAEILVFDGVRVPAQFPRGGGGREQLLRLKNNKAMDSGLLCLRKTTTPSIHRYKSIFFLPPRLHHPYGRT